MPLRGSRRSGALAGPPVRVRRSRIRLAVLVSLLIHLVVGLVLLLAIRRGSQPELLPPPSAVTMLFESGRPTGPTLPEPGPQATPSAPTAPPSPPAAVNPPSPPAAVGPPSVPAEVLPPRPAEGLPPRPAEVLPPPPAEIQPPPQAAEPAPNEAVPVEPPPPRTAPSEPPPTPAPTAPTPPQVTLPPPAAPQPPTLLPPPKLPLERPPPRPAAPTKPPDFPPPMNYSFGTHNPMSRASPRTGSRPHIPGTIDMSLGPASRGMADPTPYSQHDQDVAGADWRNALSRWVAEHAYYPEQARREAQEGDAKVRVLAAPDGQVKEVELIGKSGSMWLDLALLSLFRDRHIPALPHGMNEPIEFNFTMHYVLIRTR